MLKNNEITPKKTHSKTTRLTLLTGHLVFLLSFSTLTFNTKADDIPFETVKKDIEYLASDALKGRANFSPEITTAANYIANRFEEIGLAPFNGAYKQTFSIYHFVPETIQVEINDQTIEQKNIAFVSTSPQIHWHQKSLPQITLVDENTDLRNTIAQLNNTGGDHLVILHPNHADLFQRYKKYFQQGLRKLANENTGSIVLVLSESNEIPRVNSLSANALIQSKTQELTNVIGMLAGKNTDLAKESIIYSAHYDHLGELTTNNAADGIFNGADDNASGTTAVINLASYFAKQATNQRTLLFVAFSAEEIGGFGSQYFSNHIDPNDIIAMLNIEMIGKPSKFGHGSLWVTGSERSNLLNIMNKELRQHEKEIHPDPYPEQQLFYRSDNATLARLGVPAHSFSSVQLDKDQHYHQVSDDLASLDVLSMHQVIQTLAIASEPLVNKKATPTRIDTNTVASKGKIF